MAQPFTVKNLNFEQKMGYGFYLPDSLMSQPLTVKFFRLYIGFKMCINIKPDIGNDYLLGTMHNSFVYGGTLFYENEVINPPSNLGEQK